MHTKEKKSNILTEVGIGLIWTQIKECQSHQKLEGAMSFWREHGPPDTLISGH